MARSLTLPPVRVLWEAAPSADVAPALQGSAHADVVVVGAGIAGLTAAVALAREGVDVVVLEARTSGEGTTGLSSAKVAVLHGTTYRSIRRLWDDDVARAYAAANVEGADWLRRLATAPATVAAVGPVWEDDVATTFAVDRDERAVVEEELEAAEAAGLPVRFVEDVGVPFSHHGGVVLDGQGRIDPRRHLVALAAALDRAGGRRHERTRVRGVHRHGDGHRVEAEHGDVVAADVLITTGLPILDRSLAFARTTCERSYVLAVRCDPPVDGMHLSAGEQPVSLRRAVDPSSGEVLQLVGGEGHVTGREPDTSGCYQRLADWAREHLDATEVVARWSTQDRKSADHLPHVGQVELGSATVRVATAFGKWGMTNGTVAGTALANQVLGRPSPWGELVHPRRLGPVPALASVAKANAEVAAHLVGHWSAGAAAGGRPIAEGGGRVHRRGVRLVAESQVDGERRCLGAVCPHLGGVVRWNRAERSWDCPLHASRFAVDGAVLDGPAVRALTPLDDDTADDDASAG